MEKNYLYFQPQYVGEFKCDGAKCNARCCKSWTITIDKETFEQYSQVADAQEITCHMKFNSERKLHVVTLDKRGFCPFLTENNLCRLQRDHGEEFLSTTCTTYPRYTRKLGRFFERALTLSCPVAAEMILFSDEPIQPAFVTVSEKIHSNGGKIAISEINCSQPTAELCFEIQGAIISILQERRLTIDQRLIVTGFFLDKLEEIISTPDDNAPLAKVRAVKQLIASYNPKVFLRDRVPPAIKSIALDVPNFVALILRLLNTFCSKNLSAQDKSLMLATLDALRLRPDEKDLSLEKIVDGYKKHADARADFLAHRSTLLENYLVNEIFMNAYPWRFKDSMAKNFAVFLMTYKVFELILFAATLKGLTNREGLLNLITTFARRTDHNGKFGEEILSWFKDDDLLNLMESLLEGSD